MSTSDADTGPSSDAIDMDDAIFETAIHIEDARQRDVFLKRSFHGDPEGLERMRELLEVSGESAAFFIESRRHRDVLASETLESFPEENFRDEASPASEDQPGTSIGRYLLIKRIGAGGCGIVYEAEQQEPVERRVALKVIRLGMDTETVISRFEIERQALALMDHPNIARVLDAGATAHGRPYFVMELVKGERITTYCDDERLGVKERLALFISVCHAIQHAHQKGVIHRDIKPSNILVAIHDGLAVPKIIDFGIAKATDIRQRGASMSTAMDQPVGTPAYMSPEQVEMGGIDIDTRSDVYGLGALLYELLAGRPAFDGEVLMKAGMSEMRRTLLEKEPPFPSASLAQHPAEAAPIADRRRSDSGRLASILSGDLDWIVMKAMDKDRNRRYQTANSLAMDIQRYLADEPVIARRPGRFYLLGKFIRRNRPACISAAAIAVALVVGMGAATVLYLRERDALIRQEWLRKDAEAARTEEARLRKQAQARANISRVAVLLSEGKFEEADALLNRNPLSSIDPSPEAAGVFRSLGNWNAVYGRWQQSLQSFSLLHQANRLDSRSAILEGLDLLITAPVYLERGDVAGYEAFRRRSLDLYLPARNALEAEHLLKACLLIPADEKTLARLEQVARACEAGIPANTGWLRYREWETLSLALYHHRCGDSAQTLRWSRECLETPDEAGSRVSTILCLTAMAHHRMGNKQKALEDLRRADGMIPPPPDPKGRDQTTLPGTWLSWSVARILLREARATVGQ